MTGRSLDPGTHVHAFPLSPSRLLPPLTAHLLLLPLWAEERTVSLCVCVDNVEQSPVSSKVEGAVAGRHHHSSIPSQRGDARQDSLVSKAQFGFSMKWEYL